MLDYLHPYSGQLRPQIIALLLLEFAVCLVLAAILIAEIRRLIYFLSLWRAKRITLGHALARYIYH